MSLQNRTSSTCNKNVCSLQRSNQTSIRSFFASAAQSKLPLPQQHKKKRKVSQQSTPAVENKRSKKSPSFGNDGTNSQTKNGATQPKKHQQLYLDLGQRNFAKNMECAICGMLFVHGLSEDAKQHAAICQDYKDGVHFSLLENARVVWKHALKGKTNKQQVAIVQVRTPIIIAVVVGLSSGSVFFSNLLSH